MSLFQKGVTKINGLLGMTSLGRQAEGSAVGVVLSTEDLAKLEAIRALLAALPNPTGSATSSKQDTGNTSLSSIDTKTPALGQALSAASTPVVLPAAQITTLTPPAAITGFSTETTLAAVNTKLGAALPLPTGAATSAKQDTGNTSLSSIDTKTPALGQALAAASVPVVLPAATITTLTPPAAITGFATSTLQGTGNTSLSSIDTKTPALGQALAAASTPIVFASDHPNISAVGGEWIQLSDQTVTAVGGQQVLPIPRMANVVKLSCEGGDIRYGVGRRVQADTWGEGIEVGVAHDPLYIKPGTPIEVYATAGTLIHIKAYYQRNSSQDLIFSEDFSQRKSFSMATVSGHTTQYGGLAWKASHENWTVSGSTGQQYYALRPAATDIRNKFYVDVPAARYPGNLLSGRIFVQFEMGTAGDGGIFLRGDGAADNGYVLRLYDASHATYANMIKVFTRTAGVEVQLGSDITGLSMDPADIVNLNLVINPTTNTLFIWKDGSFLTTSFSLGSTYKTNTGMGLACLTSGATVPARVVSMTATVGA